MAEYTLDDIFEPTFITLGDKRFKLRERTRSLGEKFDGLQDRLVDLQTRVMRAMESEGEDEDAPTRDELVFLMIDMLDILLDPQGDGNNGTRTHAKTILKKSYEANEIGSDKVQGLLTFCQDQMEARTDPTSRLNGDG